MTCPDSSNRAFPNRSAPSFYAIVVYMNMFSDIRGQYIENATLGAESWFRCGGTADLLYRPADIDDLLKFLKAYDTSQPLTVLGGLANTIVRDGGIRGCVLQMGKGMDIVEARDETTLYAQAGALNGTVSVRAAKAGIGGLEFLSGIPGTLGGALAMNAGAYGSEMKDILVEAYMVDFQGRTYSVTPDDLNISYRHTDFPAYMLFTGALLKGRKEEYAQVKARMNDIKAIRNETQPIRETTGGSTIANPMPLALKRAGLPEGTRAWQVVEMVGGRSLEIGGARMSEQHCNFMVNTGDATASDLENLGDMLIRRVYEEFGLKLRWEIKRLGMR